MKGKYFIIKIGFRSKTSFLCQKYVTFHLMPESNHKEAGTQAGERKET